MTAECQKCLLETSSAPPSTLSVSNTLRYSEEFCLRPNAETNPRPLPRYAQEGRARDDCLSRRELQLFWEQILRPKSRPRQRGCFALGQRPHVLPTADSVSREASSEESSPPIEITPRRIRARERLCRSFRELSHKPLLLAGQCATGAQTMKDRAARFVTTRGRITIFLAHSATPGDRRRRGSCRARAVPREPWERPARGL